MNGRSPSAHLVAAGQRRGSLNGIHCLLLAIWFTPASGAVVVDTKLPGTDGDVLAMQRFGNTLYIAGAFRSVGTNSGGGVPVDQRTGCPREGFPRVTGSVAAVVEDGAGGWFIGGQFSAVGGAPRSNLAHLLADGSLADWAPALTPGEWVGCLLLKGRTLYVTGLFHRISGVDRNYIAALDAESGAVLPWNPDADRLVTTLALRENTIYAGGEFYTIGGQPRSRLAALDAETGLATGWDPNANSTVRTLAIQGNTVFVGGHFYELGGHRRFYIGAVDATTGEVTAWDPHAEGPVSDYTGGPYVDQIAVGGGVVYVVGAFDHLGGQERGSVAAVDATTGLATEWNPILGPHYPGYLPPSCSVVAVSRGIVYVGGSFSTINGEPRAGVVALDAATGALTAWNPRPNGVAIALGIARGTVYLGGYFGMIWDWQHRAGLAAIDATTGTLKPWNPNPNGSTIGALAVSAGRVFVGGDFSSIGGQPRRNVAALDTVNGEATSWNPDANEYVKALVVDGNTVYVGGYFTQLGGQPRAYIGAIDAITGAVTEWNPGADYMVFSLALHEDQVLVGGFFDVVGGQVRKRIAALDMRTGAATAWNPNPASGWVNAIAVNGQTVYVGGVFHEIGGQTREGIAALDAQLGTATAWDPHPAQWALVYPRIHALALHDSSLYVGGNFSAIGGQPRLCLAALDTITGAATTWNPDIDAYVWSFAVSGNTVYAGGGFSRFGGLSCSGLAAFAESMLVTPPELGRRLLAFAPIAPNPVHSNATIRFSLAMAVPVDLAIFDVQGRRVTTLLHCDLRSTGEHQIPVSTDGWSEGFYFCRLAASGMSVTRKLLVLK